MKTKYILILFAGIFLFACEKSTPEIAGIDELNAISYQEKIYTQPLILDNLIVSIQNNDHETYLSAFNSKGGLEWKTNIDKYIINGITYQNVEELELIKNKSNQLILNLYDKNNEGNEIVKSIRFNSSGEYINQFTDSIHQEIIGNQSAIRKFTTLGVLAMDDGKIAVASSLVVDTAQLSHIQLSFYSENGEFLEDSLITFNAITNPYWITLASNNRIVIKMNSGFGLARFFIYNLETKELYTSPELPVYRTYSFTETSNGSFLITASAFDDNLNYMGIVINISDKAQYLWHKLYSQKSAWLFNSVNESSNSYIFSGFKIDKQLLNEFDWRSSFDDNKVDAVILKTDLHGNEIWKQLLMNQVSTTAAISMQTANDSIITFTGKYDRDIYNCSFYKLSTETKPQ